MDKIVFTVNYMGEAKSSYDRMNSLLSPGRGIPDSVILTRKELQELLGDAWEHGYDRRSSLLPEVIAEYGESDEPNKEQYISSIIKLTK